MLVCMKMIELKSLNLTLEQAVEALEIVSSKAGPTLAALMPGAPDDSSNLSARIGSYADLVMYPGKRSKEEAMVARALQADMVEAIALMSYLPGGVTFFGAHFENGRTTEA